MSKSRGIIKNRQVWTSAEEAYLREHYANGSTPVIAEHLKRTLQKVYGKARKLGLKKTAEYVKDPKNRCQLFKGHVLGVAWQFKKGSVPANKGLRRPGYAPGRMAETQFKKGARSGYAAKNWVPVGSIRIDPEGYRRIKVREAVAGKEPTGYGNSGVWPMYNRWLWEKHKGPIPPKHHVIFKDGKREHCVIENLELLPMADNARRNRMWGRLPQELAEVIQLQGVLKRKIRSLSGKEQDQRSSGSPV